MNADATSPESTGMASPRRPILVLLVDDQLFIGEVVRRMLLDQPDIAYQHCAKGTDALRRAREIQPDIILQDLVMPDIDGLEILRQYRTDEVTRSIPVVVLSSTEDAVTRDRAAAGGASGFMVKPPAKAALIARIRSLAGKRQIRRPGITAC